MNQVEISGLVAGVLSILAGIVVIIWPRVIAFIVGAYLIIVGLIAIVAALR